MKKTPFIRLVLITAALAACNKPLYQQGPDNTLRPEDMLEYENADSTNVSPASCPIAEEDYPPGYYLWSYAFRPYGWFYGGLYGFGNYSGWPYGTRMPVRDSLHRPALYNPGIMRRGFGHTMHTVVAS